MFKKVLLTLMILLFPTSLYAYEELDYSLIYQDLKIGKVKIVFWGEDFLDKKEVAKISFFVKLPGFKEEDIIYADLQNFLPLQVEREFRTLLKRRCVSEVYDQKNFKVKIVSRNKLREEIKKSKPIQNIISFLYYLRRRDLKTGDVFKINLPTFEGKLFVRKEKRINISKKGYEAFLLETEPERLKIWIGKEEKVPLLIEDEFFIGRAKMILERKGEKL